MKVAFVTNPNQAGHAVEGHHEGPERIEAILALLSESGLTRHLERIEPRDASDEEVAWVHPAPYLERLREICAAGGGWVDPDTYITPRSCDAALSAAGSCLEATEAVLSATVRSAFCAVRPPGHHARPFQAMGFCLLNNVALAVEYARKRHDIERIAIVDIDVHHGNGTQDAFYDDPNVLYVSTHEYPFYPGTGRPDEAGASSARGANVNVALPAGCGDEQYRDAFEQVVEPVVRRFRPEAIFVSCGFDAHFADPLAMMDLTVAGYGELTERLLGLAEELCAGRLVVALEGGYDLDAVAWGTRRVLEVLLGLPQTPDPLGTLAPRNAPDIAGLLAQIREIHRL